MFDIIDFCLENAKDVDTYEVEYWEKGKEIVVTFHMKNGDTETFFEVCEDE
jgi:hypothetical protein